MFRNLMTDKARASLRNPDNYNNSLARHLVAAVTTGVVLLVANAANAGYYNDYDVTQYTSEQQQNQSTWGSNYPNNYYQSPPTYIYEPPKYDVVKPFVPNYQKQVIDLPIPSYVTDDGGFTFSCYVNCDQYER